MNTGYNLNKNKLNLFYQTITLYLFVFTICSCNLKSNLSIQNTTCEYQASPLLINTLKPRFGWELI